MFTVEHLINRQSFQFLLDLEIKKPRRYQNYLGLLSLSFGHLKPSLENRITSPKTHDYLLKDELIDTDFIGEGGAPKLPARYAASCRYSGASRRKFLYLKSFKVIKAVTEKQNHSRGWGEKPRVCWGDGIQRLLSYGITTDSRVAKR